MRWFTELLVGAPYFLVGFVDRTFTFPSIGSYVYLGLGTLGEETRGQQCFQDAHSFLAEPAALDEPSYVVLPDESLDMVADKQGLIAWLQSPHSTAERVALRGA